MFIDFFFQISVDISVKSKYRYIRNYRYLSLRKRNNACFHLHVDEECGQQGTKECNKEVSVRRKGALSFWVIFSSLPTATMC